MNTIPPDTRPPEALNALDFMLSIIENTPQKLRQVDGVVNVDMQLSIDAAGNVTGIHASGCKTIVGNPVAADDPEILQAAEKAAEILRFAPARRHGVAIACPVFDLSFGFTTAALDEQRHTPIRSWRN